MSSVPIPILQMKKLRCSDIKGLASKHTAGELSMEELPWDSRFA